MKKKKKMKKKTKMRKKKKKMKKEKKKKEEEDEAWPTALYEGKAGLTEPDPVCLQGGYHACSIVSPVHCCALTTGLNGSAHMCTLAWSWCLTTSVGHYFSSPLCVTVYTCCLHYLYVTWQGPLGLDNEIWLLFSDQLCSRLWGTILH